MNTMTMNAMTLKRMTLRRMTLKRMTLKKAIGSGLLLALALSIIPFGSQNAPLAKRKKKKKEYTGTFENGVFTDKKYGFQVKISDEWNMKMQKKGSPIRFIADKKEYSIPVAFRENEFLTTSPMMKAFVDTSSMELREFVDSLKSKSYSSDQKKRIYSSLKIFDGKIKLPIISNYKLKNGLKGLRVKILRRYKLEVPRGVGQIADIVSDNVQGDLAFFKSPDDKYIIILSGICESRYYRKVNEPFFEEVFQSFEFTK